MINTSYIYNIYYIYTYLYIYVYTPREHNGLPLFFFWGGGGGWHFMAPFYGRELFQTMVHLGPRYIIYIYGEREREKYYYYTSHKDH